MKKKDEVSIGTILKGFAIFILIAGLGFSIYFGIKTNQTGQELASMDMYDSYMNYYSSGISSQLKAQARDTSIIIVLAGSIGTVFLSALLFGFGQLVDDNTQMRQLMERQMGLQYDSEPEEEYTEAKQDYWPEPQARYRSDDKSAYMRDQSTPYPTWMEKDKQSEDYYSAPWHIKSEKKDNKESDNQKG